MEHLQDSSKSGGFYLKTSATRNNSRNNCTIGTNNGHGGGTKCGRWNPTAEQVKVLTELFRAGLRTPSTDQIQKISSQLSFYGKIESKNVFYWFQNHKARERQKRLRVSDDDFDVEQLHAIVRNDEKISSAKLFQERNQGSEMEKTIQTLQLFPVKSFNKSQPNKPIMEFSDSVIGRQDDYENTAAVKCAYKIGSYELNNEHPPLDLRLSFV